MYYDANQKDGEIGLDFSEAKVGMFVCGNSNVYAYTDRKMTIGLITGTDMDSIRVMIIRNASMPHKVGECYPVNPEYFDIIDIKRKRLSQDEKFILILEIVNGLNLSHALMHRDRLYDLKEPRFTY